MLHDHNSVGINLTNPSDYTADELVISVPVRNSGMTLVSGYFTDAAYISFARCDWYRFIDDKLSIR